MWLVCLIDVDECLGNPCGNGGSCDDGVNSFTCRCVTGFAGTTCETGMILEHLGQFLTLVKFYLK